MKKAMSFLLGIIMCSAIPMDKDTLQADTQKQSILNLAIVLDASENPRLAKCHWASMLGINPNRQYFEDKGYFQEKIAQLSPGEYDRLLCEFTIELMNEALIKASKDHPDVLENIKKTALELDGKDTYVIHRCLSDVIKAQIPFVASIHELDGQRLDNYLLFVDVSNNFIVGLPVESCASGKVKLAANASMHLMLPSFDPQNEQEVRQVLYDLGFDAAILNQKNAAYCATFDTSLKMAEHVDAQALQKLFIKEFLDTSKKLPSKNVFLIGHGMTSSYGGIIAQLTSSQYRSFLDHLNLINTKFLSVLSCFAGGSNLVEIDRCSDDGVARSVRYDMAVFSETDEVAAKLDQINFAKYFKKLNQYLDESSELGHQEKRALLKSVFQVVNGSIPNIPQVRLQGEQGFKFIDTEERWLELDADYLNKARSQAESIVVDAHESVGVYSLVCDVPLVLKKVEKFVVNEDLVGLSHGLPCIVSRVPGPSHHMLKCLELEGSLKDLFQVFRCNECTPNQMFFIDKLIVDLPENIVGNDTVIQRAELQSVQVFLSKTGFISKGLVVTFCYNNTWYTAHAAESVEACSFDTIIQDFVGRLDLSRPTRDGLKLSSNDEQSDKIFFDAISIALEERGIHVGYLPGYAGQYSAYHEEQPFQKLRRALCATRSKDEIRQLLNQAIQQGISLGSRIDDQLNSLVHEAVMLRNKELLAELAHVVCAKNPNNTMFTTYNKNRLGINPLMLAVQNNDNEMVNELLSLPGARYDTYYSSDNENNSLLMVAAQHGSLELVQRFADNADLDSLLRKNFDNKSAIDFARENGHTHIVDYLNNQQNRIRTLFGISKLILAAATGIIIKTVFSGK